MEPVGERFRIGRVVARSFAIWARALPLLLGLALVVHAPCVVAVESLRAAQPGFPEASRPASADEALTAYRQVMTINAARRHLQWLFTHLSVAFVTLAVYGRLQGRRVSFRGSARVGLRRLVPILNVSLCLVILQAALHMGLGLMPPSLLLLGDDSLGPMFWMLAIAPVVVLPLSPFWVAVPAAAVEERAPLRASWRLTRRHRLAVCAILLLLYAIDWGSGQLLRLGLHSRDFTSLAQHAIWWTQDLLVVSLTAVFAAVGYHALRLEKEGVDVSDLERVFT